MYLDERNIKVEYKGNKKRFGIKKKTKKFRENVYDTILLIEIYLHMKWHLIYFTVNFLNFISKSIVNRR